MAQNHYCTADRIEQLAKLFDITIVALFAIIIVVASINTVTIFCYRKKENRPNFVVWQTLLLNLYVACYIIYFTMIRLDMGTKQEKNERVPT